MEKIRTLVLGNRHSLLVSVVAAYILFVVIEGIVMDRESRIYTFQNRFIDLNLNNMEQFQNRSEESRVR